MRCLLQLLLLAVAAAGAAAAPPPTRNLPLLSMQPAFCGQQFHTNYVWLAKAHLACLGMSAQGCGGSKCGTLSINGQVLNITNFNNNNFDVCGACEGCAVVFVGFPASIPDAAKAFEGKDAALVYTPPAGAPDIDSTALPDCPALPSPWKTLPNQQLSPKCSPSESKGSLGVTTTAAACFAKAKANGEVNLATWRGDTDKSCQVCALRWRGPAEKWQFGPLQGATSFAWYPVLPSPKPSGPCPACPPNPATESAATLTLSSGRINALFGSRGLESLAALGESGLNVAVGNDAFALGLDGGKCTCSSGLAAPTITHGQAAVSYVFASPSQQLAINVTYELRPGAHFVSKSIALTDTAGTTGEMANERATGTASDSVSRVRMVNAVTAMDGVVLTSRGKASTDTRTSSAVQFLRWADTDTASTANLKLNRTSGAFLTAQNQFVTDLVTDQKVTSLAWTLDQNWTVQNGPRTLDSAIIGLFQSARTSQLVSAEAAAVTRAVEFFLVAPSADNVTVKINIAWCENDYQLDMALPEDRESYKRIIDRAAEMGLTHILFAPRNSDISSQANNTDPWGWEQLLWFGYGQQIRMGQWKPGDPIAASTQEMLDYFKFRGVKPVAYVYPILAFLANTLPGGGSPPWITQGTYTSSASNLVDDGRIGGGSSSHQDSDPLPQLEEGGGVLRSNLANEEFIKWLPETMLAFAEQTGAGGFSFDLTYWEEHLPVASEFAQWAGWRNILSQLHTKQGCGGARCVVDNRQANHGWGTWMWALGGTYAEPLMSDEQPASWSFYEADLHTDRLAGNKQRSVAKMYRDEYCPNEALPGFAFHQTDRDPTALQKAVCPGPEGRCSNHSRTRDFDLLGFRYSLLSSIATGGLNSVVNMLPARDTQEFSLFPKEDLAFVRDWLAWADRNVPLLKLTRPVPSLATPGAGVADGTIMLQANNTGAMFLFNPTMREINVSMPLSGESSASLGFDCSGGAVLVRELASSERTAPSTSLPPLNYNIALLDCADGMLDVTLAATSARVLEFRLETFSSALLVLGSAYAQAAIDDDGTLTVRGAEGECGTPMQLTVMLPLSVPKKVSKVVVNGQLISSYTSTTVEGLPAVVVQDASWAGNRFSRAQEILPSAQHSTSPWSSSSSSSPVEKKKDWSGTFSVPQSAIDQLKLRNASYPVVYDTNPQSTDDANIPWLAPGRLLIFVKYQSPIDDTLNVTGTIDGHPLLVRKAYNTIVRNSMRFIGHWVDVTALVEPGKRQTLTLQLPEKRNLQGVYFDNVETITTSTIKQGK